MKMSSTLKSKRFPRQRAIFRLAERESLGIFRASSPHQKHTNTTLHMNDRETRRYDTFGRVQTFGKDNATDFAVGSYKKPAGGTTPPKPNP